VWMRAVHQGIVKETRSSGDAAGSAFDGSTPVGCG